MGNGAKGDILFHEREYPPLNPPRERFRLAVSISKKCTACGMEVPAWRHCFARRHWFCQTIWCTPIIRCCAAVGGSAALRMRHTPCGCRSAYLAQVQPNHYLPIVPTNAASAAMLPWQAPASPITSEVDGNCVRPTNRRQSGSEDRSKSNRLDTKSSRHSIPQAAQLFKRPTANAGIEGDSPRLSLGDQKGVFSSEREYPLLFAPLHGAGIYHPAWCRRNLISLSEPSA